MNGAEEVGKRKTEKRSLMVKFEASPLFQISSPESRIIPGLPQKFRSEGSFCNRLLPSAFRASDEVSKIIHFYTFVTGEKGLYGGRIYSEKTKGSQQVSKQQEDRFPEGMSRGVIRRGERKRKAS